MNQQSPSTRHPLEKEPLQWTNLLSLKIDQGSNLPTTTEEKQVISRDFHSIPWLILTTPRMCSSVINQCAVMKLTRRDSRLLQTIQRLLLSIRQWDCLTGSRLNQDNPKPWTSIYQATVTTRICLISHQFLPSSTSEVSFTQSFILLFRDQVWYFVRPGLNAKGWLHPESSRPWHRKHHRREQHAECSWTREAVSSPIFWPSSIGKGSSRWIYRSHVITRCTTSQRRTISEKWTRLSSVESTRQASSTTGYFPDQRSPWLTRQPISSDRISPRRRQSQRFGKTSPCLFRTK